MLAKQSRSFYSFPELKIGEILQCMEDLRIPMTEGELLKPNPNTLQKVIEIFYEAFATSNKNETSEMVEEINYPEYGEIYHDAVRMMIFFEKTKEMMRRVGIEDYDMKDLIRADSNRIRLVLSAIINFAKFREEHLGILDELSGKAEHLLESKRSSIKKKSELLDKIATLQEQRTAEEGSVNEIRRKANELVGNLKQLKREQTALSTELEELKTTKNELNERLVISEMHQNIQSEKSGLQVLEKKSRELQLKVDAFCSLEKDIVKSIQQMEDNEELIDKTRKLKQDLDLRTECIKKQLDLQNELQDKLVFLEKQLLMSQEKLETLEKSQIEKRERAQLQLNSLSENYSRLVKEKSGLSLKIEQSGKDVKELEQRTNDLKREHDIEMSSLKSECLRLKSQVCMYTSELKKAT